MRLSGIIVGFVRLPSVSDDAAAADMEDISASEEAVIDMTQTGAATASVESTEHKFNSDDPVADNTDDDDDEIEDDDDEIFQPPLDDRAGENLGFLPEMF